MLSLGQLRLTIILYLGFYIFFSFLVFLQREAVASRQLLLFGLAGNYSFPAKPKELREDAHRCEKEVAAKAARIWRSKGGQVFQEGGAYGVEGVCEKRLEK